MIDYLKKRFAKEQSIVSRKIAGEFVLVPIQQKAGDVKNIYTMNEAAGRIWELIDGGKCLDEIRDIIVQEFEVNKSEAEADLVEFLQQLELLGIVRAV